MANVYSFELCSISEKNNKTHELSPECLRLVQFSASWTLQAAIDSQEAGCRATLALAVVPQRVQLAVVVLILSSSLKHLANIGPVYLLG